VHYSNLCDDCGVDTRRDLLRLVMGQTRTSQSTLARFSGVHQPSISQFLAGSIDISDEQLDRLLCCMGVRLQVVHHVVAAELTRTERRSWRLHRELSAQLNQRVFDAWRPRLLKNLDQVRVSVQGEPHERNLDKWARMVGDGDLRAVRRALTGLDRNSIELREVSPFSGVLAPELRASVLRSAPMATASTAWT